MKRLVKSNTDVTAFVEGQKPAVAEDPIVLSDISIAKLMDDSLLALYREVKNILMLSAKGKLDPNAARDLREHTKLLFELNDRERDTLDKLTEEQLDELHSKLNEDKSDDPK